MRGVGSCAYWLSGTGRVPTQGGDQVQLHSMPKCNHRIGALRGTFKFTVWVWQALFQTCMLCAELLLSSLCFPVCLPSFGFLNAPNV